MRGVTLDTTIVSIGIIPSSEIIGASCVRISIMQFSLIL